MLKRGWGLLLNAYKGWLEDKGGRLGAALAFYTALSLAPFFIFSVSVAGLMLERNTVQTEVLKQVRDLVGEPGVEVTKTLFDNALDAYDSRSGVFATSFGILVLLLASSAVLHELRGALDIIFKAPSRPKRSLVWAVLERLISLALVLGLCFVLAVSLFFSTGLSAAVVFVSEHLAVSAGLLSALDTAFNVIFLSLIFALLYKYLPNTELGWREVWGGALFVALIFTAGKWSIGLFLGNSIIASAYGAAGSLVVFLLWVFFAAQLFFFGAELVKEGRDA